MSVEQIYERFRYHIAYDVFAVRNLGFLKDLPNAVGYTAEPQHEFRPDVLLAGCLPVCKIDHENFAAAFALRPMRSDGMMRVDYPPRQVHVIEACRGQYPWSKIIGAELLKILDKRGLKTTSTRKPAVRLSLQGLTLLGPGASMRLESSQDVERSFGTLLVEIPRKYKHGLIHVTREGRMESFDFSVGGGRCNSFLHWFQDCTVTIEPITCGMRVLLLYNVVVGPVTVYPLTLHPSSGYLKYIEAQIEALVPEQRFRDLHSKAHFLPLVRLLLETYKVEGMEVPAAIHELCAQIISSYELKVQGAMNAGPHLYNLPDVRREGQEIIWSLGGKKMARRLTTVHRIRFLDKLISQLDRLGGFV